LNSIPDSEAVHRYNELAGEAAALLDSQLARIRLEYEYGAITAREAADRRVFCLEEHLATLRDLRAQYLEDRS